ncbi:glutamate--tRNA ligase family protein [Veillonella sp. oral taxon 780]|uniref:glutamate--tRNA ligase family protein n=1 Tax=Veillonella sp. oral taxon 780 TaxID=671229 RepID=UPI00021A337E|nr:glutamate--tRNA ligase family protein [Veillonella sp. oral taxon 780]EGS32094.1 tRNA ligase class I, catalytic domain protein [Veillonella sp. oral taxon 780 str. F0422]
MKGRFAPSPTGHMHVGNLWVAFLSYWSARHQDGEYIVRIEDVDTQRSKPIYAEHILEDLSWLGFTWDEAPTYQSKRMDIYEIYLQELRSQNGYIRVIVIERVYRKSVALLIKVKPIMCTMDIV